MAYYASIGPDSGAIRWNNAFFAVNVVEEPGSKTPIGMALAVSWTTDLVALWELIIDEVELSGLWIMVDREFRPEK
jgi:hypothetical protein